MEIIILSVFVAMLLVSLLLDLPLLLALFCGLLLFWGYGLWKKLSVKELFLLSFSGVKTARGVMTAMLVIGVMTALWRASGTIAVIISYAASLIQPSAFLLLCFLLNCAVSVLTGTSFGTAATMGTICMTMAQVMKLNPAIAGGAILAGCFFGDRWSPISTSALLVCNLSGTELLDNLKNMTKTALIPFLACCGLYSLFGLFGTHGTGSMDIRTLFESEFTLHWLCILPALAVLVISLFRVKVIITLSISIVLALALCITIQHQAIPELLRTMVYGYTAKSADVAAMINGGGLLSMLNVVGILLISSCYAGIFRGTGLLDGMKQVLSRFASRRGNYPAVLLTSVAASAVSCNQTLAAMLVSQLCGDLYDNRSQLALDLEDSVIIVSPLIPWSIASAVPLATIGAPTASLCFACYLYLLPLWRCLSQQTGKLNKES